ncbi:endonuclease domain-containing protein [bacterium]|nr:endonuclease domain-containing protein [bacterium]
MKNKLINKDFHLPYNPSLIEQAKRLRMNLTAAEKKIWFECLNEFPHRVLRQRPIDNYIVDFYCPRLRLVNEIDGDSHYSDQALVKDKERTEVLEQYGLSVIRFTNIEVMNEFEGVCETLYNFVQPNA